MELTQEQRQKVTEWIAAGQKLSEIQERMGVEFDLRMTYMDARLLVDDLKLTPKDPVIPEPPKPPAEPADAGAPDAVPGEADAPVGAGQCSVTVDTVMKAGAMVSGKATFSDGQTAEWYLDQMGRFGLIPAVEGYRPPQSDIAEVQALLDRELAKLGY
ncbi:MAG TPA: hypothetical protein VGO11_11530 [Chthoniobacteraceae bacterium]|jgi:hypothetical protein|nr:hypothetical protein [Chthoniobacteraceae bacterium]